MQKFLFRRPYSLIAMNWSSGYLEDTELVAFLQTCKKWLDSEEGRVTRAKLPGAYIIVLDNVKESSETHLEQEFDQRIRTEESLEYIFERAGLCVHRKDTTLVPGGEYLPMVAWTLY